MGDFRKPSYSAALNMAQLVYLLAQQGGSMTFEEVLDTLGVSGRTARRYISALNKGLITDGQPVILVSRADGVERWSLNEGKTIDLTQYQWTSLYFATALMGSLRGTVLQDGALDLLRALEKQIPRSRRHCLRNFSKKFHSTAFGQKQYESSDDQVDALLRALLWQRKAEIVYTSSRGTHTYPVLPYTMLMHREALYLVAYSERHEEIRVFKVDKIADVTLSRDKTFEYPKDFSPTDYLGASFGIFCPDSEQTYEVEVEFDEDLYDYVAHRKWMPDQRTSRVKDGRFRMTVTVSDLFEIAHWIMGIGSDAQAIKPKELRELIVDEARKTLSIYVGD